MNYLAHILLAGDDPEAQLGGLLGDFTKPGLDSSFGSTIAREIRIHRLIDKFTDSHAIVLDAKSKFRPGTRRFAGIILDILYDHFLASAWSQHSSEDMGIFIHRFYAFLLESRAMLPERLQQIAPMLVAEDWLGSYTEFAGVERAVRRLSFRISKGGENMISGLEDAALNLTKFSEGFALFFPELRDHVTKVRLQLSELD